VSEEFIIPLIIALIAAILGPWIIEYWKWRTEPKRRILQEKEIRYFNLLTNLTGFYEGQYDPTKIEIFYEHYRTAWLYVPDSVIKSINKFFEAQGIQQTELREVEKATCNMIWQMRRDFYGDTSLSPEEFLFIKPKN